ncbi:hypothetical protein ACLOJK_011901, partial [Asimina triloba]
GNYGAKERNAEASKYRFPIKRSCNFSSAKTSNIKQSQTEPKAGVKYGWGDNDMVNGLIRLLSE